jgi:Tfp pilus assembly protein FimT
MRRLCRLNVARRGYLMIELMVYIALMAVFAAIAWPFAHRVVHSLSDVQAVAVADSRIDQVVNLLRNDVGDAAEIQSPNRETLVVKNAGGTVVTWSFDADGNASRKNSSAAEQRWAKLSTGASFSVHGAIVEVNFPDGSHLHGGRITMISNSMAINEGTR